MAHFYADIQGNRGAASRMGTKASGIQCHVRGWNAGIRVMGGVDDQGRDCFTVELTSGSRDGKSAIHIGTYKAEDLND